MNVNAPFASRWITLLAVLIASASYATEPASPAASNEPPDPAQVTNDLVTEAISWDNQRALPKLKEIVEQDGLTDDQRAKLRDAAFKASYFQRQYDLYSVLYAAPTQEMLNWAGQHFDATLDRQTRIEAGYLLLVNYDDTGVPDDIADIAAVVIGTVTDSVTPAVAARLILAAERADANRDLRLVNGLVANLAHIDTLQPIMDELPHATLEMLVHVANDTPEVADWYRALAINRLVNRAEQGAILKDETSALLTRLARTSDSAEIVEASSDALKAWDQYVPLRARVLDRRVQSRVLMFVLLAISVINAITAIGGFIFAGVMPLRARGTAARVAIRSGLVFGWLLLTIVMLVALIGGLIGFVGAPRPHRIVGFNWPAYVGTVIYVAVAYFAYRRCRKPVIAPQQHEP